MVKVNDHMVDFDAVVNLMDDEIRRRYIENLPHALPKSSSMSTSSDTGRSLAKNSRLTNPGKKRSRFNPAPQKRKKEEEE